MDLSGLWWCKSFLLDCLVGASSGDVDVWFFVCFVFLLQHGSNIKEVLYCCVLLKLEFLHNYIYIFILVQAMAKILYGGSILTEKISS